VDVVVAAARREDQRAGMTLNTDLAIMLEQIPLEKVGGLAKWLDEDWLEEGLLATGTTTLRRRRLPAWQVLWLVLGMSLMTGLSIKEVAAQLGVALPRGGKREVAPSALVQARQRLGADVVSYIFHRAAETWGKDLMHMWRSLAVFAIDGTFLRTADSDANHEHFGRHYTGKKKTPSSHPSVRMVVVSNVRSRMFVGAEVGPCTTSELTLAKPLLASLPSNAVVILDRLYTGAPQLLLVAAAEGRHYLVRAKKRQRWTVVKQYSANDRLVDLTVSDEARKADPSLPRTWQARAITYRTESGEHTLLTSLLDPVAYPAREVIALYRERWEIELAYGEVKASVLAGRVALRSQTVAGVYQEVWGLLLAYNLVRREMAEIAREANLPPCRISFTAAFHHVVYAWRWSAIIMSPGSIIKHLSELREAILRFVLPPRRSERRYDRVVKRKDSPYARKSTAHRAKAVN
jgi:hypothetical protein